jgi:predicted Zn-dependent peptidase
MRGQTVGALAGWYAGDYFFDETIDGIDNASEHIAKITKDDMVKLAREFIAARTWTLGEVGNVEADDTNRHYDLLAKLFK